MDTIFVSPRLSVKCTTTHQSKGFGRDSTSTCTPCAAKVIHSGNQRYCSGGLPEVFRKMEQPVTN